MYKLLNEFLNKYEMRLKLKETDITHMFLPRDGVIHTYVVENSELK